MSPIDWNQSFSVGHAEVDRQHREFLNIMNEVESILLTPSEYYNRSTRLNIMEKLLRFTAKHFELEQKLMQEFEFPFDFSYNHWRSHKSFDAKLYTLYRQLLAKELVLDSCILTAIRDKFFNHIQKEDKVLFQALFSGVAPHVYQEHNNLQTPCVPQFSLRGYCLSYQ